MALRFQRLTRPEIRNLGIGSRIAEHGIIVERMKSGDLRFSVNVMIDGQRVHRVIGRESEGVTREQAERAIEAFRTKAREGRLDLPTGRKVHRTFREAAEQYLENIDTTLRAGMRGYQDVPNKKRHLLTYLVPYFKDQRADKVTDFAVQHYVRHRLEKGAVLATVNRELSTLSHFMNRMIQWKWIKADDKPRIEKEDEPRKKIVILSGEHQQALMKGGIADQDPATWLFIAFGLNTAMRHGEILRVRWDEIDFASNRIHIPQAKAGQRIQPITGSLRTMLENERKSRDDQEGYIFTHRRHGGKTPYRKSMARQFERAVLRAGLEPTKVTPHVMRHTAITALVQAGVDLPTIQKISGHKTLLMVMRYVHLADDHIDTAIAALDTGMFDAITPELHTAGNLALNGRAKVVAISSGKAA
ncbi:tyrosine-type recombinase/integrase [Sphingorhabdus sp.]|uniref:tyrosine-type recombinase/integrase n=1 Tax=Sphingorhabdus sp. TaxID=1902408 RepID=UPI003594476E